MEKEFVTYEQALALKELGFDEPCLGGYIRFRGSGSFELAFYKYRNVDFNTTSNIYVSAPLYQQAFRWFREKYNLKISFPYWNGFNDNLPKNMQYKYECYIIPENAPSITIRYNDRIFFETYEEAELACLIKLIEIVNESKKD